jgi:hypothetical protein
MMQRPFETVDSESLPKEYPVYKESEYIITIVVREPDA